MRSFDGVTKGNKQTKKNLIQIDDKFLIIHTEYK